MFDSLLFTGGAPAHDHLHKDLIASGLPIVAADSGLDSVYALKLSPSIICGDMDSVSDRSLTDRFPDAELYLTPRDKDETDTETALRLLFEKGYRHPLIVGGGPSGRPDHQLGIFRTFHRELPPRGWVNGEAEMLLLCEGEHLVWGSAAEVTISCFPVGKGPWKPRSSGLRWPLEELEWSATTVGISNETLTRAVEIHIMAGRMLMIRPLLIDGNENGPSLYCDATIYRGRATEAS